MAKVSELSNSQLEKQINKFRKLVDDGDESKAKVLSKLLTEQENRDGDIDIDIEEDSPSKSMQECPFCAEEISHKAKKCKHCGETIDMTMRKIQELETRTSKESPTVFMNAGGGGSSSSSSSSSSGNRRRRSVEFECDKSRTAALLLCFFLGGLGIHKFYLGSTGGGVLYLLLCWTGIPSCLAFIEFFILLFTSNQSFAKKYGTKVVYDD